MGTVAGRPREFDREAALRQLQKVFWERGYDETSIADLVAATGLASARLYAAFGAKDAMFRECVELYRREEGGFADRALEEAAVADAVRRMFRDAVAVYTRPTPRGCMVVSAATSCASAGDAVRDWLIGERRGRTEAIRRRLAVAVAAGELPSDFDTRGVSDALAALLHGVSVQARDGVSRRRLEAVIPSALGMLGPEHHGPAGGLFMAIGSGSGPPGGSLPGSRVLPTLRTIGSPVARSSSVNSVSGRVGTGSVNDAGASV